MHYLNKLISKDFVFGIPNIRFQKDKVCETYFLKTWKFSIY